MPIDQNSILERGIRLSGTQLYHAAIEELYKLSELADDTLSARRWDEIGKAFLRLGFFNDALTNFQHSLAYPLQPPQLATYRMHEAIAYRRLGDYDKAQRLMVSILRDFEKNLEPYQVAVLYSNLSVIQGLNEFFIESLKSAQYSLQIFEQESIAVFLPEVLNNIGTTYIELHQFDKAEEYLLKSMDLDEHSSLATIIELSRLYFESDRVSESVAFVERAMLLVWSSIMTYEKNDIARLCTLLARVSYRCGERNIAIHLLEKAQLIFGQLGLWREWERAQQSLDAWLDAGIRFGHLEIDMADIQQFLAILNVINSQEVTLKKFGSLLDLRVVYANVFADCANLSIIDRNHLIYVCRLADYGLTVLDTDVVTNPRRSEPAWNQYQQHSIFSVEMLDSIGLETPVLNAISDHHEKFDGSGFPAGKKDSEISFLARLFSVVDYYTSQVQMQKLHSEVLLDIRNTRGQNFDPEIVDQFNTMFEI